MACTHIHILHTQTHVYSPFTLTHAFFFLFLLSQIISLPSFYLLFLPQHYQHRYHHPHHYQQFILQSHFQGFRARISALHNGVFHCQFHVFSARNYRTVWLVEEMVRGVSNYCIVLNIIVFVSCCFYFSCTLTIITTIILVLLFFYFSPFSPSPFLPRRRERGSNI